MSLSPSDKRISKTVSMHCVSDLSIVKTCEFQRRRKLRLLQVREQSKDIAKKIRKNLNRQASKGRPGENMIKGVEINQRYEKRLQDLQGRYEGHIQNLGTSHSHANSEIQENEQWKKMMEKQQKITVERGRKAIKELKESKCSQEKAKILVFERRKALARLQVHGSSSVNRRENPPHKKSPYIHNGDDDFNVRENQVRPCKINGIKWMESEAHNSSKFSSSSGEECDLHSDDEGNAHEEHENNDCDSNLGASQRSFKHSPPEEENNIIRRTLTPHIYQKDENAVVNFSFKSKVDTSNQRTEDADYIETKLMKPFEIIRSKIDNLLCVSNSKKDDRSTVNVSVPMSYMQTETNTDNVDHDIKNNLKDNMKSTSSMVTFMLDQVGFGSNVQPNNLSQSKNESVPDVSLFGRNLYSQEKLSNKGFTEDVSDEMRSIRGAIEHARTNSPMTTMHFTLQSDGEAASNQCQNPFVISNNHAATTPTWDGYINTDKYTTSAKEYFSASSGDRKPPSKHLRNISKLQDNICCNSTCPVFTSQEKVPGSHNSILTTNCKFSACQCTNQIHPISNGPSSQNNKVIIHEDGVESLYSPKKKGNQYLPIAKGMYDDMKPPVLKSKFHSRKFLPSDIQPCDERIGSHGRLGNNPERRKHMRKENHLPCESKTCKFKNDVCDKCCIIDVHDRQTAALDKEKDKYMCRAIVSQLKDVTKSDRLLSDLLISKTPKKKRVVGSNLISHKQINSVLCTKKIPGEKKLHVAQVQKSRSQNAGNPFSMLTFKNPEDKTTLNVNSRRGIPEEKKTNMFSSINIEEFGHQNVQKVTKSLNTTSTVKQLLPFDKVDLQLKPTSGVPKIKSAISGKSISSMPCIEVVKSNIEEIEVEKNVQNMAETIKDQSQISDSSDSTENQHVMISLKKCKMKKGSRVQKNKNSGGESKEIISGNEFIESAETLIEDKSKKYIVNSPLSEQSTKSSNHNMSEEIVNSPIYLDETTNSKTKSVQTQTIEETLTNEKIENSYQMNEVACKKGKEGKLKMNNLRRDHNEIIGLSNEYNEYECDVNLTEIFATSTDQLTYEYENSKFTKHDTCGSNLDFKESEREFCNATNKKMELQKSSPGYQDISIIEKGAKDSASSLEMNTSTFRQDFGDKITGSQRKIKNHKQNDSATIHKRTAGNNGGFISTAYYGARENPTDEIKIPNKTYAQVGCIDGYQKTSNKLEPHPKENSDIRKKFHAREQNDEEFSKKMNGEDGGGTRNKLSFKDSQKGSNDLKSISIQTTLYATDKTDDNREETGKQFNKYDTSFDMCAALGKKDNKHKQLIDNDSDDYFSGESDQQRRRKTFRQKSNCDSQLDNESKKDKIYTCDTKGEKTSDEDSCKQKCFHSREKIPSEGDASNQNKDYEVTDYVSNDGDGFIKKNNYHSTCTDRISDVDDFINKRTNQPRDEYNLSDGTKHKSRREDHSSNEMYSSDLKESHTNQAIIEVETFIAPGANAKAYNTTDKKSNRFIKSDVKQIFMQYPSKSVHHFTSRQAVSCSLKKPFINDMEKSGYQTSNKPAPDMQVIDHIITSLSQAGRSYIEKCLSKTSEISRETPKSNYEKEMFGDEEREEKKCNVRVKDKCSSRKGRYSYETDGIQHFDSQNSLGLNSEDSDSTHDGSIIKHERDRKSGKSTPCRHEQYKKVISPSRIGYIPCNGNSQKQTENFNYASEKHVYPASECHDSSRPSEILKKNIPSNSIRQLNKKKVDNVNMNFKHKKPKKIVISKKIILDSKMEQNTANKMKYTKRIHREKEEEIEHQQKHQQSILVDTFSTNNMETEIEKTDYTTDDYEIIVQLKKNMKTFEDSHKSTVKDGESSTSTVYMSPPDTISPRTSLQANINRLRKLISDQFSKRLRDDECNIHTALLMQILKDFKNSDIISDSCEASPHIIGDQKQNELNLTPPLLHSKPSKLDPRVKGYVDRLLQMSQYDFKDYSVSSVSSVSFNSTLVNLDSNCPVVGESHQKQLITEANKQSYKKNVGNLKLEQKPSSTNWSARFLTNQSLKKSNAVPLASDDVPLTQSKLMEVQMLAKELAKCIKDSQGNLSDKVLTTSQQESLQTDVKMPSSERLQKEYSPSNKNKAGTAGETNSWANLEKTDELGTNLKTTGEPRVMASDVVNNVLESETCMKRHLNVSSTRGLKSQPCSVNSSYLKLPQTNNVNIIIKHTVKHKRDQTPVSNTATRDILHNDLNSEVKDNKQSFTPLLDGIPKPNILIHNTERMRKDYSVNSSKENSSTDFEIEELEKLENIFSKKVENHDILSENNDDQCRNTNKRNNLVPNKALSAINIARPKPPPTLAKNYNNSEHNINKPHELSTIIEYDTLIGETSLKTPTKHASIKRENQNQHKIQTPYKDDTPPKQLTIANCNNNTASELSQSSLEVPSLLLQSLLYLKPKGLDDNSINSPDLKEKTAKPFVTFEEYLAQNNLSVYKVDTSLATTTSSVTDFASEKECSTASDQTLPDIVAELMKRNIISKPFSSPSSEDMQSSAKSFEQQKNSNFSASHNSASDTNGVNKNTDDISVSSSQNTSRCFPYLEDTMKTLGLGWAAAASKKAEESIATSSSTTSNDIPALCKPSHWGRDIEHHSTAELISLIDSYKSNGTCGTKPKKSCISIKDELEMLSKKIEAVKCNVNRNPDDYLKITSKSINSLFKEQNRVNDVDNFNILFGDRNISSDSTLGAERTPNNNANQDSTGTQKRTSTPVELFKSPMFAEVPKNTNNTSQGLFSNASDLSSVKLKSTKDMSDNDDLTIPNISLHFRNNYDTSHSSMSSS